MEHEKPNAKQSSNRGNSWESRENQVMEIRVTTGEREEITTGIGTNKENKVEPRICNILTKVWSIERACHWLFFFQINWLHIKCFFKYRLFYIFLSI